MGDNVYIYLLADPRTKFVRYVGQTTSPSRRYAEHLADEADTPKTRWLREMQMPPQMIVVERSSVEWAQEREQFWIDLGRRLGWQLTNAIDARATVRVRRRKPKKRAYSLRSIDKLLRSGRALRALPFWAK